MPFDSSPEEPFEYGKKPERRKPEKLADGPPKGFVAQATAVLIASYWSTNAAAATMTFYLVAYALGELSLHSISNSNGRTARFFQAHAPWAKSRNNLTGIGKTLALSAFALTAATVFDASVSSNHKYFAGPSLTEASGKILKRAARATIKNDIDIYCERSFCAPASIPRSVHL